MDWQMPSFQTCRTIGRSLPCSHSRCRSGTLETYTWEAGEAARSSASAFSNPARKSATGVIDEAVGRQASFEPTITVTRSGLCTAAPASWAGRSAIREPVTA
ncbi:hypothetical protein SAVIM40S_01980 [Streptomyces avidinii]